MSLSSFAAVSALSFVGVFSSDSAAVARVYAFVESPDFPVADRAGALRLLAVDAFGFSGPDSGVPLSDSAFLDLYLSSL